MAKPDMLLATPGFGEIHEVDEDGNPIVPAAPRKRPHNEKHAVASQIDVPKHLGSRGKSRTPPIGKDETASSQHQKRNGKRRETSLDRAEQEAGDLARAIARREREILEIKEKLKEAETNLRSRTEQSRGRERSVSIEKHKKHARDRYERSDPNERHERKRHEKSEYRHHQGSEGQTSMNKRQKHARNRYEKSDFSERCEPDRHDKSNYRRHRGFEGRAIGAPETAREAAREALSKIGASPLAHWIRTEETPSRVKHATFTLYETNNDPVAHLQHYLQAMFMHERDDALLCKMFPSSLGKVALAWYHKLPAGSILCWSQLAEEFIARFLTSRAAPKTFDVLNSMKQTDDETIRAYAKRYWETFNEIENCNEEYALATFKTSLPVHSRLRESLTMHPAKSLAKLMERIQEHARVEDDIIRSGGKIVAGRPHSPEQKAYESKPYKKEYAAGEKDYVPYKRDKDRVVPYPKSYFSVNTVFNIPIYKMLYRIKDEPWFRRPAEMTGNHAKRRASQQNCSYHRDWGHMTEDCVEFKRFLEEMVAEGHLREFITNEQKEHEGARRNHVEGAL